MSSLHLPSPHHHSAANGAPPTMSSREIADLVESRHDKVKQSIERLADRGVITLPPLGETTFKDSAGKTQRTTEYRLVKRDSYVVVAQLSPEFTARLVDRWQELEEQANLRFAIPATLSEALQLAADQARQIEQQQALITEQQPKVAAFDRIADADGMVLISDAAKVLQVDQKKLFAWLRSNRWIFRRGGSKRYIGFADKLRADYLKHKFDEVPMPDGSVAQKERVFLTPKGITKLATIFDREARS